MLDLSLFRNPTFSGANTVMGLVGLAMFGIFFFNSLYLQNVLGYSAIQTGATFLPLTGLIILVAPVAGRFTDVIGPRWLVAAGLTLLTGALLLGTPGYGFGLGFAVRLAPGIAGVPGSAGEFMWAGYAGTYFWVDPKEQVTAVFMSQAPSPIRAYYRKLIKQLVYQAMID